MSHLLSPLSFRGLSLRNRIVMPPMWSGHAEDDGTVSGIVVEYHRRRAAAGCGLVIVEHTYVSRDGRYSDTQLGAHEDSMIPGLSRLAEAIRKEGAAACLQLSHAGTRRLMPGEDYDPIGPCGVRNPFAALQEVPRPASKYDICDVVNAFGKAAARARQAGFDAVEIHGAHGFLLSQFQSPITNRRTDEYGGSCENRMRLHTEILTDVRQEAGRDFPVFVRLGAHDETRGGVDLADSCEAARVLVRGGADLIDVSGGLQGFRSAAQEPGYFVPYAQSIKASITVPVIVTGGIRDPFRADRIIRDGKADLVGVGRAMLEDPEWAAKAIQALG